MSDYIIVNSKKLTNVRDGKPLLHVNSLGNPSVKSYPNSLLPKKLYTEKYMRISNALPFSCPDKWVKVTDEVPAANDGNLVFGKSVASGLPVCKNVGGDGSVCYTQEIGLMGGDMFLGRDGIKECADGNGSIVYLNDKTKYPHKVDHLKAAKDICDRHNECQGFVTSNGKKGMSVRFVGSGLGIHNVQDMSNVRTVGGTKFTTYIKNTAGSDYSPFPISSLLNVSGRELGIVEKFVGDCGMRRNMGLLIVVVLLVCCWFMFSKRS